MATKLVKNSYVKDVLQKHSGASQVGGDALDRVDELFQEFLIKVASRLHSLSRPTNARSVPPKTSNSAISRSSASPRFPWSPFDT